MVKLYFLLPFLFFLQTALGTPDFPYVAVTGIGKISVEPDIITVKASVLSLKVDVNEAVEIVGKKISTIIKETFDIGVVKKDVSSLQINISPEYNWKSTPKTLRGYRVRQQLVITLRDVKNYSALVAVLTKNGVYQINQIEVSSSEQEHIKNQAIIKALDNARDKADIMALKIEAKVGKVYSIEETTTGRASPRLFRTDAIGSSSPKLNFELGTIDIHQKLEVIFLLDYRQ